MNATDLLSGIGLATFAASGIFFLKFWKASRDRFFLLFCAACWCLSLERLVPFLVQSGQHAVRNSLTEGYSWVYLLRLTAFVLILMAVVDRNRCGSDGPL